MEEFRELDEPIHKIAVLRANAIGDFIFTLPALEALKARYPQAEIVLLGKPWHQSFLQGRPGPVDRVLVIPPCPGVGEPADTPYDEEMMESFFSAMRRENFDIALQLHGGGRYSNPFVRQLGARITVGFKTEDALSLDRSLAYIYFQSEYMRYLEAVARVGARPVRMEPRLAVTSQDHEEAAPWLPQQSLAVLHPGASDPRRRWSAGKFAQVGDALADAGAAVAVTGTAREQLLVDEVIERMQRPARNLCDTLSLGGLAALLSHARVVVANDTGPLHLAVAVGAPTVGLFWCGNLINGGPLTRHRHRPAISWRLHCPECGTHCLESSCDHRASFIEEIPVAEVRDSALALFSGSL